METQALVKILEMHKSIIGANSLYLKGSKGFLTIASTTPIGKTLIGKLPSSLEFTALSVDYAVLQSFLKNSKNVELTVDREKISIRGKGIKGEIPFETVDSFPKAPTIEKAFNQADADWLSAIVPRVAIKSLDKSGFFAAKCHNSQWSVCCSDNIHGAFAFADGNSDIAFSLTPTDAYSLSQVLKTFEKSKIDVQDNMLIIQQSDGLLSLQMPLIEGEVTTKDIVTKGSTYSAKFQTSDLKEAFKTISPIASTKDAPAIELNLKENMATMKVSSKSGTLTKALAATIKVSVKLSLSFELLNRLLPLMEGAQTIVSFYKVEDTISRITLKSNDVYYLMLTSA